MLTEKELHPDKKDKLYSDILRIIFWILIFLPLVMCFIAIIVVYKGGHLNLPTVTALSSSSAYSTIDSTPLVKNADGYSEDRCWNQVSFQSEKYYWLNGCHGKKDQTVCSKVISYLSTEEIEHYQAWVTSGKKAITGCN